MNKEQGFTLIETLVAVMITLMLSAAGLYGWNAWQQQQRLWQTATQVRDYLLFLRDDANWHNRDHRISVQQHQGHWCLVADAGQAPACTTDDPFSLIPAWPEVALAGVTPSLGFYGLRSTAWAGRIALASPAGGWVITVSAWGRIRLCQQGEGAQCR
ncbi:prepilin peptidase-dependent protein [Yokenella regensburgei]|uniref:prepilin peptidase-dependent protein n=1 Tax=Yokenella regensburgei TaxID=158877 RepID=UPI003ED8506D